MVELTRVSIELVTVDQITVQRAFFEQSDGEHAVVSWSEIATRPCDECHGAKVDMHNSDFCGVCDAVGRVPVALIMDPEWVRGLLMQLAGEVAGICLPDDEVMPTEELIAATDRIMALLTGGTE